MKALFLTNDASIPDIISVTRSLMQTYADEIGELHVLMPSSRSRTTVDGSITIHEVKVSKWGEFITLPRVARSLIRKYGIEIVSTQDPFGHGLIGYLATRTTSAKFHIQVHSDFLSPWFTHPYSGYPLKHRVRLMIADFILPHADGIRTVAPRLKRSMLARYENRIKEPSVIPVLVSPLHPSDRDIDPPFPITLLVMGKLQPRKRFSDAIKALALLRKKYDSVGLIVAGEGEESRNLRNLARALGVENYVRFLGMRADVSQLFGAAHILVQPSAYEGYSRTMVESALARVPIVTTDVGMVGDVLKPNIHVLTTPVGDPMSIADQVTQLIEHPDQKASLVSAAHAVVLEHLAPYRHHAAMIAHDLRDALEPA